MTLGRNNSLRNQNFIADRAVLAFGQTGFRAGGFNRCVDYFRMTLSRCFLGITITAFGASICCCTSFGASCGTVGQHITMIANAQRQANSLKNCIGVSAGVVPFPNRVKVKVIACIKALIFKLAFRTFSTTVFLGKFRNI